MNTFALLRPCCTLRSKIIHVYATIRASPGMHSMVGNSIYIHLLADMTNTSYKMTHDICRMRHGMRCEQNNTYHHILCHLRCKNFYMRKELTSHHPTNGSTWADAILYGRSCPPKHQKDRVVHLRAQCCSSTKSLNAVSFHNIFCASFSAPNIPEAGKVFKAEASGPLSPGSLGGEASQHGGRSEGIHPRLPSATTERALRWTFEVPIDDKNRAWVMVNRDG